MDTAATYSTREQSFEQFVVSPPQGDSYSLDIGRTDTDPPPFVLAPCHTFIDGDTHELHHTNHDATTARPRDKKKRQKRKQQERRWKIEPR